MKKFIGSRRRIASCAPVRSWGLPLCIGLAWLTFSITAQAGTIISAFQIVGHGLGAAYVPAIITGAPGNDNYAPSLAPNPNLVVVTKRFDHGDSSNNPFLNSIEIQFSVGNPDPGGTTEYHFFESVDNNTGSNWDGYTVELGFNVSAGFTQSTAGDGLSFDAPGFDPTPTSTAFANVATSEDLLTFSTGVHSSGSEIYEFSIDVPDGIQAFTLRQYPHLVPEPGTLALALGALAGVTLFWRRRRSFR